MNTENSADESKLMHLKRATDIPTIQDKNHPVYWSEEKWQTEYFNLNQEELAKLEMFKNLVIQKYEEAQATNN